MHISGIVELKILHPRGFEVCVCVMRSDKLILNEARDLYGKFCHLAVSGITLFAFHGQLNKDFGGNRNAGTWSENIVEVQKRPQLRSVAARRRCD